MMNKILKSCLYALIFCVVFSKLYGGFEQKYGYGINDVVLYELQQENSYCIRMSGLGIKLYNGISDPVVPTSWSARNLNGVPNRGDEIQNKYRLEHVCNILYREIQLIPEAATSLFDSLVVVENLSDGGYDAAGLYDEVKGAIYIGTSGNGVLWSDFYIRSTFHHELSSYILISEEISKELWYSFAPDDFKYPGDKDWSYYFEDEHKVHEPEYYYQQGLVSDYGETSYENDFNEYARLVFTEPTRMASLIDKYPQIKKKYLYFKQVYLDFDKGFQPFFDKIDAG